MIRKVRSNTGYLLWLYLGNFKMKFLPKYNCQSRFLNSWTLENVYDGRKISWDLFYWKFYQVIGISMSEFIRPIMTTTSFIIIIIHAEPAPTGIEEELQKRQQLQQRRKMKPGQVERNDIELVLFMKLVN